MHNKLLKKFYILRLFTVCLPRKKIYIKNNYFLCKYIALKTPYSDINKFIKEIYKLFFIQKELKFNRNLIFSCCNKTFCKSLKPINKEFVYNKKNTNVISNTKTSFYLLCNDKYTTKQISFIKDKKIPIIGFINMNNIAQLTDYVLLLENQYFASLFLFKYVIKKLLNESY